MLSGSLLLRRTLALHFPLQEPETGTEPGSPHIPSGIWLDTERWAGKAALWQAGWCLLGLEDSGGALAGGPLCLCGSLLSNGVMMDSSSRSVSSEYTAGSEAAARPRARA